MLNFIRQFFRDEPALNTEIPRYPPFAKGLPSVQEDRLLTTQQELVDKLRQTLPFNRAQFDELMLPVIKRYAAFVHLLPASEAHHHRGAGGLLHHGLEVAHIAARSSEDVMFAAHEEPRRRRELEPRWRLAVCLAGLTHDVGKPVSDLSVTDSSGEHVWNAYTENLADWTARESVDRYFLHWHKGRHRRHEQFSVLVMERVLTRECLNWLSQYGPEIPHALLNSVAMADTEHNDIGPLIRRADNTSVERDMKRYQAAPNESLGVPVERYIIDAMRRLISQGKWQVNENGSRVWHLTDGLHVVWPAAAHEITRVLSRDGVAGVPRDPDSIADILIDRGLATPRETESTTYRYWPMRPASFTDSDPNRLMMLRLGEPHLLFSEPPPAMAAEVIESRPKPKDKKTTEQASAPVPGKPAKAPEKKHRSDPILTDGPTETSEARPRAEIIPENDNSPDAQLAAATAYLQEAEDDGFGRDDLRPDSDAQQNTSAEDSTPEAESAGQGQGGESRSKRNRKNRRARSKKGDPSTSDAAPTAKSTRPAINFEAGQAEHILQALYAQGVWETHLYERRDHVFVAYPEGAALAGSPTDVQRLLADEGLLKTDPLSPMLKVQTIDGTKGLLLATRISTLFLDSQAPEENRQTADKTSGKPPADQTATTRPSSESEQRPQSTTQQPNKDAGQASAEEPASNARQPTPDDRARAKADPASKPGSPASQKNSKQAASTSENTPPDLALGLLNAIRDTEQKIPCRRERQDGWIYVSQVVIKWYAASVGKTAAEKVRAAAVSHPDIVLEGKTRIGVKEQASGE